MSDLMMVTVALAVVNTVLALVLGLVYLRNHKEIRSPFTLGLLLFAVFIVIHNGTVVYYFLTMMARPAAGDEPVMFLEALLQSAGLGALLYATLR